MRTWGTRAGRSLCTAVIGILIALFSSACDRPTPEQNLARSGYVSLVFEIDDEGAEQIPNLAERVVDILRTRVDPNDEHHLVWRVVDPKHVEVRMPAPPPRVSELRRSYLAAVDALRPVSLSRDQLVAVLCSREQRPEKLRALVLDVPDREPLLQAAANAFDAYERAQTTMQAASAPATEPAVATSFDAARQTLEDADSALEDAVAGVLKTTFPLEDFLRILELERTSKVRAHTLDEWRRRFPELRDRLDDAVAKYDAWRAEHRFLDEPDDLKRLVSGCGKVEFRILAEVDPANPTKYDRYRTQLKEGRLRVAGDTLGWFRVDDPMQFFNFDSPAELEKFRPETSAIYVAEKSDGHYYVLGKLGQQDGLLHEPSGQRPWRLDRARIDRDAQGRGAVSFELDTAGGTYFEELTRRNIDKALCILVDDVAYAAPNIKSAIRTQGQITGDFSLEKVTYLAQTMQAGTAPARLKQPPVSETTVPPASAGG